MFKYLDHLQRDIIFKNKQNIQNQYYPIDNKGSAYQFNKVSNINLHQSRSPLSSAFNINNDNNASNQPSRRFERTASYKSALKDKESKDIDKKICVFNRGSMRLKFKDM